MRNLRFLRIALDLLALVAFVLCLLCGLLFYEFYFKWISFFENERYFDPTAGVVYHDTAIIWGIFSLALLLMSLALRLVARKIKMREIR